MRKWILISVYLTIWILVIPDRLPYFIIYDKTRVFMGILVLAIYIGLPVLLYYILTDFNLENKKKWIFTSASLLIIIPHTIRAIQIDKMRLHESNKQTQGIVYKKWTSGQTPLVKAKYNVDNKEFETFSKNDYEDRLLVGDTVTIIYWTECPDLSMIKELEY